MLNFLKATAVDIWFLTVPARPSTVEVKEVMTLTIGLMIEMYIFTRMIEVLMSKNKGYTVPGKVKILAGITLAVCAIGVIALFNLWAVLAPALIEI